MQCKREAMPIWTIFFNRVPADEVEHTSKAMQAMLDLVVAAG